LIDLQVVSDFAYQYLQKVTIQKAGTHFHTRCPLCGDSKKSARKKRFHLDWHNGNPGYHCFNCDESGPFLKLYAIVKGISEQEAKKELFKYDSNRIKRSLARRKSNEEPIKIKSNKFNYILNDCISEDKATESVLSDYWMDILRTFREERQIPKEQKLYYCFYGRYRNRIIVPVFKGDDIIYFQGRRIPGSPIEPKYLNPTTEKQIIIHNEEHFDRDKYIIVTEGLIDAFMVGDQGTSCLGKEISEPFLKALFSLTDKGVIIALDNDKDGKKSLDKFMKNNAYKQRCRYFLMPDKYKYHCKDANDIKTKYNIENLYELIVESSYSFTKAYLMTKM